MFGLTMFEGAAVLGEAPVFADGSWLANVPPYIPMHLQPIDQYGLAIRNQQLWIQGMPRRTGAASAATSRAPARASPPSARTRRVPSRPGRRPSPRRSPIAPSSPGTRCPADPHRQVRRAATTRRTRRTTTMTRAIRSPASRRPTDPVARPRERPGHRLLRQDGRVLSGLVRVDLLPGHAQHDGPTTTRAPSWSPAAAPCSAPVCWTPRPRAAAAVGRPRQRPRLGAHAEAEPHGTDGTHRLAAREQPEAPRGQGRHAHRRRAQDHRGLPDGPRRAVLGAPEHGFVPYINGDPVDPQHAAH